MSAEVCAFLPYLLCSMQCRVSVHVTMWLCTSPVGGQFTKDDITGYHLTGEGWEGAYPHAFLPPSPLVYTLLTLIRGPCMIYYMLIYIHNIKMYFLYVLI